MKKLVLLFVIGVLFSCSNDTNDDTLVPQTSSVQIRIQNASSFKFENIIVASGGKTVSYENLLFNRKSTYKTFDIAYSYAFVELQINGKTYTIQPIDYVGETPLDNGNYTYKITVNPNPYQELSLELIKD